MLPRWHDEVKCLSPFSLRAQQIPVQVDLCSVLHWRHRKCSGEMHTKEPLPKVSLLHCKNRCVEKITSQKRRYLVQGLMLLLLFLCHSDQGTCAFRLAATRMRGLVHTVFLCPSRINVRCVGSRCLSLAKALIWKDSGKPAVHPATPKVLVNSRHPFFCVR